MNPAVDQFLNHDVRNLMNELAEIEMSVEPLSFPEDEHQLSLLAGIVQEVLTACERVDEAIGENQELRIAVQEQFREMTAPWCNQSWIINRARSKPRGFPGDYQMLLAIYEGVPIARGFGGYLDRLCLKMTLGKAVQSRLKEAKSFLGRELQQRSGDVKILDIASGPGREFQRDFAEDYSGHVNVTLVDSDAGALEYVRRHVSTKSNPNLTFNFKQHNALRMRSPEAIIKTFGRQDIIYSVGLADYLPDRHLVPILASWKEALNPGGCVYVAFKDHYRYNKVEYQWLMDWHFLQRDDDDCRRIFSEAGYDMGTLQTERDQTGVILCYKFSTVANRVPTHIARELSPHAIQPPAHQHKLR